MLFEVSLWVHLLFIGDLDIKNQEVLRSESLDNIIVPYVVDVVEAFEVLELNRDLQFSILD